MTTGKELARVTIEAPGFHHLALSPDGSLLVTACSSSLELWEVASGQRIATQHLSPMYVSIHATDRALRAVLLGKPDVPDVLEQIRRFGELGIAVHTQIVALPG